MCRSFSSLTQSCIKEVQFEQVTESIEMGETDGSDARQGLPRVWN